MAKWQPRFHVLNGNPLTHEWGWGLFRHQFRKNLRKIDSPGGIAAVVF